MATIPSITDLYSAISSDFKNRFNITTSEDLKDVLEAIAMVQSGTMKLAYLFLAELQKNILPDTADFEANGGSLERFGRIRIGREPRAATQGEYTLNITGSAGGTIEAGRQFRSTANSLNPDIIFQVVSDVTLTGSAGTVEVICLTAGADAQLDVNNELELTVTLPNIDGLAYVDTVDVIPTDNESIDDYRAAIIDSYKLTPQGGAASDYKLWAADVVGVRRVYPYRKPNVTAYVQIYVEATQSASTDGKGTPPNAMLLELYDASAKTGVLELDPDTSKDMSVRGRRPLGCYSLEVLPIELKNIVVNIFDLEDDSVSVRSSISTAISAFLVNVRPFIDAADGINSRNDTLYRSDISTVVTQLLGLTNRFTNITITVAGVEVTDYLFEYGEIPTLQTINYL